MREFLQLRKVVQVGLVSLLLVGSAACAGSGPGRSSSKAHPSNDDPDVITQEEIQAVGAASDAYSLVRQLEPMWLRKRGNNSLEHQRTIMVYLGSARYGTPASLRQIQISNVQSIEFLSPSEASARYGNDLIHGAIQVHLKGSE